MRKKVRTLYRCGTAKVKFESGNYFRSRHVLTDGQS